MDWQTQRGIMQVTIGVCCFLFALSMAVRSHRHDGLQWPVPWRMLVAVWIFMTGGAYLMHSYYWLAGIQSELGDRRFMWPLYLLTGLSVWVLARWFRDEPPEVH